MVKPSTGSSVDTAGEGARGRPGKEAPGAPERGGGGLGFLLKVT